MIEVNQARGVDRRMASAPVAADEVGHPAMPGADDPGGLAGWVLRMVHRRGVKAAARRLHVVETLALGGRRQLLLVTCDGERFLVGSGADRVETIVRVGAGKTTGESWV